MRISLYGFTSTVWRGARRSGIGGVAELDHVSMRFRSIRCFSARQAQTSPQLPKRNPEVPERDESDAFYIVRKGDLVGVYKSLSDCQAQASSLVCDPSVCVYKGYSLRKETEEYLASHGIKHAIYSLNAMHVKEDLFGSIIPCPFKQPNGPACIVDQSPKEIATKKGSAGMQPDGATCVGGSPEEIATPKVSAEMQPVEAVFLEDKSPQKKPSKKRSADMVNSMQPDGAACFVDLSPKEKATEKGSAETQPDEAVCLEDKSPKKAPRKKRSTDTVTNLMTCFLEFDGSSKGNPGKAGAGAILRNEDGSVVCRLREGLGAVTSNAAEYRALIMGLKYALKKGYQQVRVQGDSHLICMQVSNAWQTKNQNMTALCKEVKELENKFLSFKIRHVKREFNSDADAQANLAVDLPAGHVYVE